MHLKVGRDLPPSTDPTQHFPCRGLLGWEFQHRSRTPGRGKGGRQEPCPAAGPRSIPSPPAGTRLCPASAHHPSLRLPQPPARSTAAFHGGQGGQPPGFRANLFKREAAAGLERQGSAFLRQSTGRHACCNPIHGGSSTDRAPDNPPGPPRPYL